MQSAFREEHVLQCGYCTPGMVMSAVDLLEQTPDPDEPEIREAIAGNLCRCTVYQNILSAVETAAESMDATDQRSEPDAEAGEPVPDAAGTIDEPAESEARGDGDD